MKKLAFILLTTLSAGYSQIVSTNAVYYVHDYIDDIGEDVEGECMFAVEIDTNIITLAVIPEMTLEIVDRKPSIGYEGGEILEMYTRDNDGIGCITRIFISPERKEIHIRYSNIVMSYILE